MELRQQMLQCRPMRFHKPDHLVIWHGLETRQAQTQRLQRVIIHPPLSIHAKIRSEKGTRRTSGAQTPHVRCQLREATQGPTKAAAQSGPQPPAKAAEYSALVARQASKTAEDTQPP